MAPDAAASPRQQQPGRHLVCFDFDHTIADANSDTFILKCLPGGRLPPEVKSSYVSGRWTDYMRRVIGHLHDRGVTAEQLQGKLGAMPLVAGMGQLLRELAARGEAGDVDCVIVSDSNSLFIEWALGAWGHAPAFSRVFTNPARVEPGSGRLQLEPHDPGHGCDGCPVNMCKRATLTRYIQERAAEGLQYDRIAYVGDGGNDFCPALMLGPRDVLFVRKGFALEKALAAAKENQQQQHGEGHAAAAGGQQQQEAPSAALAAGADGSGDERGARAASKEVRAEVVMWDDAAQILGWMEREWGWGGAGTQ